MKHNSEILWELPREEEERAWGHQVRGDRGDFCEDVILDLEIGGYT